MRYCGYWESWTLAKVCAPVAPRAATPRRSVCFAVVLNPVAGVAEYKIRYKISGSNQWVQTSSINPAKVINSLVANTEYKWQVKTLCQVPTSIPSNWTAKQTFTTTLRMSLDSTNAAALLNIFPNPAQDYATVQFTLHQSSQVSIHLYDVSGKDILTLLDEKLEPGEYSLPLNASEIETGIYMVEMICDGELAIRKLVLQ